MSEKFINRLQAAHFILHCVSFLRRGCWSRLQSSLVQYKICAFSCHHQFPSIL